MPNQTSTRFIQEAWVGTAWCWGHNSDAELGDGTTTDSSTPVQVGTATNWTTISAAAGGYHSCGVRGDGTAWCWGQNSGGELGDGTTTDSSTPVQVGTATNWTTISAAVAISCGVRSDGTAWCWGNNAFGQLGDGTTTTRVTPTQVVG
jgi:alpha-tubulin suppressor-like RCC1 family protein